MKGLKDHIHLLHPCTLITIKTETSHSRNVALFPYALVQRNNPWPSTKGVSSLIQDAWLPPLISLTVIHAARIGDLGCCCFMYAMDKILLS